MLLKDYIPNVPKRFYQINFSGIAFDSLKVKKTIFFLQLKEKDLMGIIIYHKPLKKEQK